MSNKKKSATTKTKPPVESTPASESASATTILETPRPEWIDGPSVDEPEPADQPKAWADPYRATFTCPTRGFEIGENRRFKQVVVTFSENPGPDKTSQLKEAGFQYRAHEKAWTTPANAATREIALRLGMEWRGDSPGITR